MSDNQNKEIIKDIQEGFDMFDYKNFGIVNPNDLKEIMDAMNMEEKNPFLYRIIENLCHSEIVQQKGGINANEFLSIIDNELDDNSSIEGMENIFSIFSNSASNTISLTTFSKTARDIGDEEKEEEIKGLIEKSNLTNKEMDFNEFYEELKGQPKPKKANI